MKRISVIILLLLTLTMVLPLGSTVVSAASNGLEVIDYSKPDPLGTPKEYTASEFLKLLINGNIPSVEAEFLDENFGEVFRYSDVIPKSCVEATYSGGDLSISASEYKYITADGTSIIWKPTQATLSGKKASLTYSSTTKKYEGKLTNVAESASITLKVDYSCDIIIKSGVANAYKNYTYQYAHTLCKEEDEYSKKLDEYNVAKKAYDDYIAKKTEYETLKSAWDNYNKAQEFIAYRAAKSKYDEKLKVYDDAKAKYEEEEKKYQEAYRNYNNVELKEYGEAVTAYNKYLASLDAAEKMLAVMDSIYFEYNGTYSLYGTIAFGQLETVLNGLDSGYNTLDKYGQTGISKETIKQTCNYVAELKEYLISYKKRSYGETPENKIEITAKEFNYYKENYADITRLFTALRTNLENIWLDAPIRMAISAQENGAHYYSRFIETLLHIYVIETGLSSDVARDEDWFVIGENDIGRTVYFYFKDVLDPSLIIEDRPIYDPSKMEKFPEEMKEPEPPVKPEPPDPFTMEDPRDTEVAPTKPSGTDPGANTPKPTTALGTAPKEVANPGSAPKGKEYTDEQKKLMKAKRDGILVERATGSNVKLTFNSSLEKTLVLEKEKCLVSFYDDDGNTLLDSYTIKVGEDITYKKANPSKEQTDKNVYTFDGWKNENGEKVSSFGKASGTNVVFYASYKAELRKYTITWKVNGKTTTETYKYGETPTYKGKLEKDSTDKHSYSFSKWNTPIVAVKGDATYEAEFTETARKYTVLWKFGEKTYTEKYEYGATPSFKYSTDDFIEGDYVCKFNGWDTAIKEVKGDVTYTAKLIKTAAAKDGEGNNIQVEFKNDVYVAQTTTDLIRIDTLLEFALIKDKEVALEFESVGAKAVLDETVMREMKESGCQYIYIYEGKARSADKKYAVRFADSDGKDITLKNSVTIEFDLNGTVNAGTKVSVLADDGSEKGISSTYKNGAVLVELRESSTLMFKTAHKVTVGKVTVSDESENGLIIADKTSAYSGETITLDIIFPNDYLIDIIQIVGTSGTEYQVNDADGEYTFVMPDEDVTVSVKLKIKQFKITFIVNGEVFAEQIYDKGSKIEPPKVENQEGEDGKIYAFVDWSPLLVPVTEDATYTAEFKEIIKSEPPKTEQTGTGIYFVIAAVGFVALILLAAPIIIIVVVVTKNKKKKQEQLKHLYNLKNNK